MDGQLAETLQAPESTLTAEKASFLKQPKAVWATALAAVFVPKVNVPEEPFVIAIPLSSPSSAVNPENV